MSNGNTAIAVRDEQIFSSIAKWGKDYISPVFQGRDIELWKQDAALAIIESEDLRACMTTESGKISLVRALQRSATSGMSLNPQKGESALVAIGGKISFWPMKNGLAKKALESGVLEFIQSDTVYKGDTFTLKKTAKGDDYDFIPNLENRGEIKGFFAVALFKNGRSVVEYWTLAQANEHKEKYGKGLSSKLSAWNTNPKAMYEKSVLKALLSGLKIPELERVLEIDNKNEEEQEAELRDVTEPQEKGTGAENLANELKSQEAAQNQSVEQEAQMVNVTEPQESEPPKEEDALF